MRLHRIQKLFALSMFDHPDILTKPSQELLSLFVGGGSLPERLGIYQNNILSSLTKALLATYPLINKITGEAFAATLMRSFVQENPPDRACLAYYGKGLDKFIENFPPARQLPYLADLARLEWAINEAYYAEDDHPVTPSDIEDKLCGDLYNLSLRLRSSVSLMRSKWPLIAIRKFCLTHDEKSSETLNLDQQGGPVIVYRPNLEVRVISIELTEFRFLEHLRLKSLGEALEETLIKTPAFDFSKFLQRHLSLETFSNLTECT